MRKTCSRSASVALVSVLLFSFTINAYAVQPDAGFELHYAAL